MFEKYRGLNLFLWVCKEFTVILVLDTNVWP